MNRSLVILAVSTLSIFSVSALAQNSCEPSAYVLDVASCVTPQSPVQIQNVQTGWLLKNEGASRITDGMCVEHIPSVAAQFPKGTNIQVAGQEARRPNNILRQNKSDVFCNYSMDVPVQIPVPDASCGITGVQASTCTQFDARFIEACLRGRIDTEVQVWQKAACLVDSYHNAFSAGINKQTYDAIKAQLSIIKDQAPPAVSAFIESRIPGI